MCTKPFKSWESLIKHTIRYDKLGFFAYYYNDCDPDFQYEV